MKRLIVFLGATLFCLSAFATDLQLTLAWFGASPTTNRNITLQSTSPFQGNLVWLVSDTNGKAIWSNAPVGLINGNILAPPGKIPFQVYITSASLGTIDASNCAASGSATTYPAGGTAWSIATSDQRYALNGTTASNNFYPLNSNPSNYANLVTVTGIVQSVVAGSVQTNGYGNIVALNTNQVDLAGVGAAQVQAGTNTLWGWALSLFQTASGFTTSTNLWWGNTLALQNTSSNAAVGAAITGAQSIIISSNTLTLGRELSLSNAAAANGALMGATSAQVTLGLTNTSVMSALNTSSNVLAGQIGSVIMSANPVTNGAYAHITTPGLSFTNIGYFQTVITPSSFIVETPSGYAGQYGLFRLAGTDGIASSSGSQLYLNGNGGLITLDSVTGIGTFPTVTATTLNGILNGAATSATSATNAPDGNKIASLTQVSAASNTVANLITTSLAPGTNAVLGWIAATNAAMVTQLNATNAAIQVANTAQSNVLASTIIATNVSTVARELVVSAAAAQAVTNSIPTWINTASNVVNSLAIARENSLLLETNGTANGLTMTGSVTNGTMNTLAPNANYLGVSGVGWGGYVLLTTGIWTNQQNNGWSINMSGSTAVLESNLQTVTTLTNGPIGTFANRSVCWGGYTEQTSGRQFVGEFNATNLTAQWRGDIGTYITAVSNYFNTFPYGNGNYSTLSGYSTNSGSAATAGTASNVNFYYQQGGAPLFADPQATAPNALSGQLWGAMPKPWIMVHLGCPQGAGVTADYNNETNALWTINDLCTNGYLSAMTNLGSRVGLYMETGWGGLRNTNWAWVVPNWGTLTWDTNRFPSGLPWLCSVAASNKLGIIAQFYVQTNIVPLGATEWVVSWDAGDLQLYTNGTGSIPTNIYGHYEPVSSPNSYQLDAQELTHWGLAGVCSADSTLGQWAMPQTYAWDKALLTITVPNGWNQATYHAAYLSQNTNLFNFSTPWNYITQIPTTWVTRNPLPPVALAYETLASDDTWTWGYQTVGNHTGVYYDNSNQGSGSVGLASVLRDFCGTQKANQGARVIWLNSGVPSLVAIALTHGLPLAEWRNYPTWGAAGWSTWYAAMINPYWQSVWNDDDQNWPVWLNGGTNVCKVNLAGGNRAVGFFNDYGASNMTNTVTWANLNWKTNQIVDVIQLYPSYTDYGTNYSGSFSLVQTSGAACLMEFDNYGVSYLTPPYTPTNILTTIAWYDFADMVTNASTLAVTNRVQNVAYHSWSETNTRPTINWPTMNAGALNGLNVMSFNGSYNGTTVGNQQLACDAISSSAPYTITMIYRIDSFPNANSALYGDAVGLLGLNVFNDNATHTNLFITVDGGASGVTISNGISPGKWRMDVLIANGANTGYYTNGVLRTNWVSGSSSFSGLYINSLPPYYYNNTMNLAEMWIRSENGSNHIAADWNYVTNKYANTNF